MAVSSTSLLPWLKDHIDVMLSQSLPTGIGLFLCLCVCVCPYVLACTYLRVYAQLYLFTHLCVCMYMLHMYVCMYVCVHVCIYITRIAVLEITGGSLAIF